MSPNIKVKPWYFSSKQKAPFGAFPCAADGCWPHNLSRAFTHYLHNGMDYIFTL